MITASDAHSPIKSLHFATAYYDKIFTRISGPPWWLIKNLNLAFVPTSNNNYVLRYNPNWEVPEPPSPPKCHCSHSTLSGRQSICTCSCCHYRCPTHCYNLDPLLLLSHAYLLFDSYLPQPCILSHTSPTMTHSNPYLRNVYIDLGTRCNTLT